MHPRAIWLVTGRGDGAEMPRQRPRRRRRRSSTANVPEPAAYREPRMQHAVATPTRRWIPSAGVVTAMGVGIWLGVVFGGAGGLPETIALWVGVLMAGLGGGRIFRRSLQNRQRKQ